MMGTKTIYETIYSMKLCNIVSQIFGEHKCRKRYEIVAPHYNRNHGEKVMRNFTIMISNDVKKKFHSHLQLGI